MDEINLKTISKELLCLPELCVYPSNYYFSLYLLDRNIISKIHQAETHGIEKMSKKDKDALDILKSLDCEKNIFDNLHGCLEALNPVSAKKIENIDVNNQFNSVQAFFEHARVQDSTDIAQQLVGQERVSDKFQKLSKEIHNILEANIFPNYSIPKGDVKKRSELLNALVEKIEKENFHPLLFILFLGVAYGNTDTIAFLKKANYSDNVAADILFFTIFIPSAASIVQKTFFENHYSLLWGMQTKIINKILLLSLDEKLLAIHNIVPIQGEINSTGMNNTYTLPPQSFFTNCNSKKEYKKLVELFMDTMDKYINTHKE